MRRSHKALRTCLICGRRRPQSELIRLVLYEGKVVEDREGNKNGRAGYYCRKGDCRQYLMKERNSKKLKRRFARAFRVQDTQHI